ncbi:TLR4 interactor with leucine rich repeats [Brienomyrus brachyistius]|uniref:TLR4 interactor with leucine rich repeats n=1 Tax=Brienomyrus brachyistius TaxID=42636 RepID=UPI0020B442F7|nr:TLR4 interactor with leucine rich repeats [Brienomyrus brachyistius]
MASFLALCFLLLPGVLSVTPTCPDRCDCQHAQHLLCANRGLRAVPRAQLPKQADILVFSLAGNFIQNITASDFSRLDGLIRLDLQYNQIRKIHPKAFEKLSKLQELYLGNNLISVISPGTLQSLNKLKILYGNSNDIKEIKPDCFGNLGSIIKLRLDGNSIEKLPDAVFKSLPNLMYLHLESNKLRYIHRNAFINLTNLRFLNLSGNKQKSIRNILTFSSLQSLTTLLVSENEIQHIGNHVFQNLKKLLKLSFSNNKISQVELGALKGLSNVRELLMDGNELLHIRSGVLDPLEKVEELDFSRNRIYSVEPSAFTQLQHLKILKLEKNQLTSLSGGVFALNGVLYNLYLNGNNWTCDCNILEFKQWMNTAHSQGRLLTVFVQCQHPDALKGRYLDYLNSTQLLSQGNNSQPCGSHSPVESLAGGVLESAFPRKELNIQADQGGVGQTKKPHAEKNKRKSVVPRSGSPTSAAGKTDRARTVFSSPGTTPKPSHLATKLPLTVLPVATVPLPGEAEKFDRLQQERLGFPLVTDPCQFNRHFIVNVTVSQVSSNAATITWSVREHRSSPASALSFRVLFDRFGRAVRFPRFVYVREGGHSVTLHELSVDTTYMVCVEGVVGGAVCQVASRDHCTGVVTLGAVRASADLQLVTMAMLGVNALLLLLVGGAWMGRRLRRRLQHRKSAVHVRHMYSTRRPFRAMAPAVASDFTSYQSSRPRMCPVDEGDLIEFPCDRFLDNNSTRRDEALQRFTD